MEKRATRPNSRLQRRLPEDVLHLIYRWHMTLHVLPQLLERLSQEHAKGRCIRKALGMWEGFWKQTFGNANMYDRAALDVSRICAPARDVIFRELQRAGVRVEMSVVGGKLMILSLGSLHAESPREMIPHKFNEPAFTCPAKMSAAIVPPIAADVGFDMTRYTMTYQPQGYHRMREIGKYFISPDVSQETVFWVDDPPPSWMTHLFTVRFAEAGVNEDHKIAQPGGVLVIYGDGRVAHAQQEVD
jgi:hypothetical protein